MALMGGFGSPMGFASIHIIHHAFSDTDKDFHTPTKGFFNAYLGWYLSTIKISSPVLMATRHLLKDKFYPRLEKYKISIWWGLAIILALIDFRILIFSMGLAGFIGWHFTCITNSAAHRIGSQRYDNGDHSTNIWWLSWIFWQGSGALQNNHHHAPGRFHDSERWYEFDIAKYLIPLLATKIHDRSRP
jgi:stearoyl-CoA desaturase (delta-9 desaturase)